MFLTPSFTKICGHCQNTPFFQFWTFLPRGFCTPKDVYARIHHMVLKTNLLYVNFYEVDKTSIQKQVSRESGLLKINKWQHINCSDFNQKSEYPFHVHT